MFLADGQPPQVGDGLLQRSDFVRLVKEVLKRVAEQYQLPVDLEFAVSLAPTPTGRPALNFHLLQCRPQNLGHKTGGVEKIKLANIPTGDWLFLSTQMAPQGLVEQVEYVVYVDPLLYRQLESSRDYTDVARLVGHLNKTLEGKVFVLIGPGRWGSSDYQQGVPVTYADIFNTRALVEVAVKQGGYTSEPSYGTHFFQDLVETQIYPLGVYPEDPGSAAAHDVSSAPGKLPVRDILNWDFLNQSADQMSHLLDLKPSNASRCMKVIHVPTERPGWHLKIAMDGEYGLGYFSEGRP